MLVYQYHSDTYFSLQDIVKIYFLIWSNAVSKQNSENGIFHFYQKLKRFHNHIYGEYNYIKGTKIGPLPVLVSVCLGKM